MHTIPAFYFDPLQLEQWLGQYRDDFNQAEPFPHIVIDNFLPQDIIDLLVEEFPAPDAPAWKFWGPGATFHSKNKSIEKLGTDDERQFGPFTRHFMGQLNSATFLRFLEALTDFKPLIPDPQYNDCGLHSTGPGGKLMIHTDANRHPVKAQFDQCLNLILFLNPDWKEEYGGHLELWNASATHCEKRILPVLNRAVLFDTGTKSYHGHPQPLTCPADRRRNSLALYYYMPDRPLSSHYEKYQAKVHWIPTSAEDKTYTLLKKALYGITPPICRDIFKNLKQMKRKLYVKRKTEE